MSTTIALVPVRRTLLRRQRVAELIGATDEFRLAAPSSPLRATQKYSEKESEMSLPQVVSRDEWLVSRKELLAEEKALTRARDALNTKRRELPMVRIDKDYLFDGPDGKA
ncbi:MAG: DUF899 family protein, partial [Pseudonocardiaceae bacterium]